MRSVTCMLKMNFLRLSLAPRSFTVASRLRLGALPFLRHGFSRTLVIKHALETNISFTLSAGHSQETTILENQVHPDDRTIFVGKMNPTTTEETLKKYLSDYGDIEEVKVIRSESKNACAFVVFKDVSSVGKAIEQPLAIDLRSVRIEKYKKHPVRDRKIYVGIKNSLDNELSENDIRVYFSQFGTVETVDFIYDFQSKKRKDFCFVGFSSEEYVMKALASPTQQIGEHLIEVRKSTARAGREFIPGKIMLEDLPHDVTAEEIQEYFLVFGNLSHIDMVFYRAGSQPRNFAFVTFTDSNTVDRLTGEESTHMINGRAVSLHRAISHSESIDRDLKVFIENVSPHTNLEGIKSYFGTFGGVNQIHLVESWLEKHDNQCGIVKFANSGGVTNTMSCPDHVLDGSVITVRRLGLTVKRKTHLPISSFFNNTRRYLCTLVTH